MPLKMDVAGMNIAAAMRKEGKNYSEIGRALGVSKTAATNKCDAHATLCEKLSITNGVLFEAAIVKLQLAKLQTTREEKMIRLQKRINMQ